jgi:hypothetical protein
VIRREPLQTTQENISVGATPGKNLVWDMPDPREARATPKQKEAMAKAPSPAQGSANAEPKHIRQLAAVLSPQTGGMRRQKPENAGSKAGNRD